MGKSGYSLQWVHLSPYSVKFPKGLRCHLHPMPPSGGRYEGSASFCIPVDVVERSEPWFARGIKEAQQNRDPQGLPILPLPYLVLMKFQSGRVQDIADVSCMLGQASEDILTAVRELFKKVQPGDLEDLESLIKLGQLEFRPPKAEEE